MESNEKNKSANASGTTKKNIGVKVDEKLWRNFRAQAISQGKTAGELLDELIAEYVGRSRSGISFNESPDQNGKV